MKKQKPNHQFDGRAVAETLYGCEKPKTKLSKAAAIRKARKLLFGEPSLPHPKNKGGEHG